MGDYWLHCDGAPELLFTDNESNAQRLWGQPNASPYVKDAFHQYIIAGRRDAVNPAKTGTKAAAHYVLEVLGGASQTVLRLATAEIQNAFGGFREDVHQPHRRRGRVLRADCAERAERRRTPGAPPGATACSGASSTTTSTWSWLREHKSHPLLESVRHDVRNTEWFHMLNADVISMPDKWEYPWYAAWDLAFHTIALSLVDFDFAKEQLC